MYRAAIPVLALACSAAVQPPRAGLTCTGPVSCGREQLVEADRSLQHAIQQRGVVAAFADALLDDGSLLGEGKGMIRGKQPVLAALEGAAPFAWTLARADVSGRADLGYSFGWTANGHYAAVWRRQGGDWKLAVFLRKGAEPQDVPPPAWFVPLRGEREPGPAPQHSVSAADSAFAALAEQSGTQAAFTTYAAQDAVQLARTMVFGREGIHRLFDGAPLFHWKPLVEDASQDLGYTIGSYAVGAARGNYLTIWRLEPDGAWRYVLDGGVSG
ncbi:MAG TPA: nuclear transport factor 2 family protein [Myxococcales bacterium]|nr:nuclear transport factor 2 family protein [Myxococcales bacterium]